MLSDSGANPFNTRKAEGYRTVTSTSNKDYSSILGREVEVPSSYIQISRGWGCKYLRYSSLYKPCYLTSERDRCGEFVAPPFFVLIWAGYITHVEGGANARRRDEEHAHVEFSSSRG